ncbi:MAG: 2-oxo acid dehydrogenase subunit E2 [Chloroflexi bacterium]|nr:dihydrolipoamide acetyltransferase family protein [Chloroflexota bacterium]MQC25935.1 2-oxo acid dehydrogenase subunit E2 [Chloroflexota bacterium]
MADLVSMPKLGFDMAEGILVRWVKKEGEAVDKGELLAEIETDKATLELESPHSGVVRQFLVDEGAVVAVNKAIAVVGDKDETIDIEALIGAEAMEEEAEAAPTEAISSEPASAQSAVAASQPPSSGPAAEANGKLPEGVRATPLARRIAEDKGIDLRAISGSGPKGRVVKKDVEGHAAGGGTAGPVLAGLPSLQMPELGTAPADKRVPLTKLRSAIARRMTQSRQDVPHFYVTHEYAMERVLDVRKQVNALLQSSAEKLSVNDFVIKAAALALRQFPNLNAALDGDAVIQFGRVNIGVAVAVDNGLLVVVCKDADRKPLRQISSEVRAMADRARSGSMHPDDIQGSTFSISNMGMFDVAHFVAIINPPEAAILALGSAREVPVVRNGQVVPGQRMQATISIDHRVSDGAEGAQYLQALGQYLENPAALLL